VFIRECLIDVIMAELVQSLTSVGEAMLLAFHRETLLKRSLSDLSIWNPAEVAKMSRKNAAGKRLSIPEVRKLMESVGEENLDQLQRRTFDYVSKFSKVDAESAEKLVQKLVTDFGVDEMEAVQIVNCMPKTIEELRVFLSAGRKIIETSKLEAIVNLLNEHRKLK
jgi:DNA-directed RNA polymerase subunit F